MKMSKFKFIWGALFVFLTVPIISAFIPEGIQASIFAIIAIIVMCYYVIKS